MNIDRLLDTSYTIDEVCELLKEEGYINYQQYCFSGFRQVVFFQKQSNPIASFGISFASKSMIKREYSKFKKMKIMLVDKKDPKISYFQIKEFLTL